MAATQSGNASTQAREKHTTETDGFPLSKRAKQNISQKGQKTIENTLECIKSLGEVENKNDEKDEQKAGHGHDGGKGNPATFAPAGVVPSKQPDYPDNLKQKSGRYRWIPLQPELLDHEGAQFFMIGEKAGGFGEAVHGLEKDKRDERKVEPEEEIERLDEEDSLRIEHLKEDDPVFADFGVSSKQYRTMSCSW